MKVQLQIISNKKKLLFYYQFDALQCGPNTYSTAVLIYNLVFCLNKAR